MNCCCRKISVLKSGKSRKNENIIALITDNFDYFESLKERDHMEENNERLEDVIEMLDFMTKSGVSRIKVETSETVEAGEYQKAYHHGRCDVGSPFATGKLFDLEEETAEEKFSRKP